MTNRRRQSQHWAGHFGMEYTDRNPQCAEDMDALLKRNFGVGRYELNTQFLGKLDRGIRILEVGCNVGTQLACLRQVGFRRLYGIDVQAYALSKSAYRDEGIHFTLASALSLPFSDGAFDLVFTSGLLIHISPDDLPTVIAEMHRCTRTFIWGWEYFSEEPVHVPYRGQDHLLWKRDFVRLFQQHLPGLECVTERRLKYLQDGNTDTMYLLRKL